MGKKAAWRWEKNQLTWTQTDRNYPVWITEGEKKDWKMGKGGGGEHSIKGKVRQH